MATRGNNAAKEWLTAVAEGRISARTPDLVLHEVANALVNYVRAGSMTASEADAELTAVLDAPVERIASPVLARQSLALAALRGISAYDAAYLALALGTDAILVTADRMLAAEAEKSALLPDVGPPG